MRPVTSHGPTVRTDVPRSGPDSAVVDDVENLDPFASKTANTDRDPGNLDRHRTVRCGRGHKTGLPRQDRCLLEELKQTGLKFQLFGNPRHREGFADRLL